MNISTGEKGRKGRGRGRLKRNTCLEWRDRTGGMEDEGRGRRKKEKENYAYGGLDKERGRGEK